MLQTYRWYWKHWRVISVCQRLSMNCRIPWLASKNRVEYGHCLPEATDSTVVRSRRHATESPHPRHLIRGSKQIASRI